MRFIGVPENRPQVIAQKRFLEHREVLGTMDLESRFRYIFERNLWSNDDSRSGTGSTLLETETLRREIPLLLKELGAQSLLDIPCGDFRWLSGVELPVSYLGADIVDELVIANTTRFGSEERRFLRLDLTESALPQSDLVLCRDCLVHLSFENIGLALANITRSGAKYLLMTNFPGTRRNRDIADGDWRTLNFELPPFSLPVPRHSIVENCLEGDGAFQDKSLSLWQVSELP